MAERSGAADLRIRRARAEEYGAVDALITEAYAHDYGPRDESDHPMRLSEVRDREHEVWVATDAGGALLGSVTLRAPGGPSLHEDVADGELDLRLLGVSPRARRLGVGAALMRHSAHTARSGGFDAVVLKTAPNMSGAHRLYESLGFLRAPERDGLWIGGERLLDLFTYVFPVDALPAADLADTVAARGVLGSFPTGVVLVTGGSDAPAALIVQSFVSLSIDPPRILLSIGNTSTSWPRIARGGTFAATVLAEGQGELAREIAGSRAVDKLAGIRTSASPEFGHPVLPDGASWFECEIRDEFDGGDHRLVVAEVRGFGLLEAAERPLVFARSRFAAVRAG